VLTKSDLFRVPNILTVFRIAIIPVFVVVFYCEYWWSYAASALLFALASFTDMLDGYLARKLNQETHFGRFLDPVADKLLVAVALVLLVGANGTAFLAVPAAVIVCREIIVSALREWMAEIGQSVKVHVSNIGKVKTATQMSAIILLLSSPPLKDHFVNEIGILLLYSSAVLTLWSMCLYLKVSWRYIIGQSSS
jgi:CDP-diacylglycerol---glycerol-3-phosphate 3-phosphatidyltransferase